MRIQQATTFVILSLALLLINLVCLHACQIETNEMIEAIKEKRFNFQARKLIRDLLKKQVKSEDFNDKTKIRPIQLTFDKSQLSVTQYGGSLSQVQIQYLDSLLEEAGQYFKKMIKVLPYPGNIKMNNSTKKCLNNEIPEQDKTTGIHNSDLHLYISYENNESFLASAIDCQVGDKIGFIRPNFGGIRFSRQKMFKDDINDPKVHTNHLNAIIHEVVHVLGFSTFLFPYYLDSNQIHMETIRNSLTFVIGSPRVQEAARKYYNCSTLCGMQLENQGDEGSFGNHWETTILYGEIMNPVISQDYQSLSIFTIKLLQDTGFYSEVNENFANQIFWGKNKGCEFVKYACGSKTQFPEFIYEIQQQQCTFLNEGQTTIIQHSHVDNNCLIGEIDPEMSCMNKNHPYSKTTNYFLQSFTPTSQCFYSDIIKRNYLQTQSTDYTRCFQFKCIKKNQEIKIFFGANEKTNFSFSCKKEDEGKYRIVSHGDVAEKKKILCPNSYEQFCSKKYCPQDCSQKGFCLNGKCLCQPGYARSDCSLFCGLNQYAESQIINGEIVSVCVDKCTQGKFINPDNTCHPWCITGYFKSQGKCKPCDSSCSQCKGPRTDQCTACHFLQTLNNGICV